MLNTHLIFAMFLSSASFEKVCLFLNLTSFEVQNNKIWTLKKTVRQKLAFLTHCQEVKIHIYVSLSF